MRFILIAIVGLALSGCAAQFEFKAAGGIVREKTNSSDSDCPAYTDSRKAALNNYR